MTAKGLKPLDRPETEPMWFGLGVSNAQDTPKHGREQRQILAQQ